MGPIKKLATFQYDEPFYLGIEAKNTKPELACLC